MYGAMYPLFGKKTENNIPMFKTQNNIAPEYLRNFFNDRNTRLTRSIVVVFSR